MSNSNKLEAAYIDVWANGTHYKIIGLYNPPNNIPNVDAITDLVRHPNSLVIGDFNAHSNRWGYRSANGSGRSIENLIDTTNLTHVPSLPIFLSFAGHSSTPDLALVHANLMARAVLSLDDAMDGCGHRPLCLKIRSKNYQPARPKLSRWNFKKANWKMFGQQTDVLLTDNLIDTNPDKSSERFVEGILTAAKASIPRGQVKTYKPFWTKSLTILKSNRNIARRKAEISKNMHDCVNLRKQQATLKRGIIQAKRISYRTFVSKLDFRKDGIKAHSFISSLNNEKSNQHWEPIYSNVTSGKILSKPDQIANALCKNYAAVSRLHVTSEERKSITLDTVISDCHSSFHNPFSRCELELAIACLKNGKSAGPDGIFPDFIRHLGEAAKQTFLKLINLTWETRVPHQWRKAEVISLLKKGKPANQLTSYRPISLTSACCKVAEKMVERRLREYLESKEAISDRQAGFRKHRSTIDQIVKFTQAAKDGFNHKQSTLAVFVDFKAAYDKIWRRMLVHKLKREGVAGNMLEWIKSFLSQRLIRCKFQNKTSCYRQLRQGLPQGAVLSCLLFNVMIDDLQKAIETTAGVQCLFFADDVVLWATGSNIQRLQDAINSALCSLENWSNRNKMEVSAEKTTAQLFTLSTKPSRFNVQYKGVNLQQTSLSKYLGITLDTKLSYNTHVASTADKAQKRNNLLKRLTSTKWGATQDVLCTAYKTYVRPVMEYGSEVVSLSSRSTLTKYDVVQNNALRTITGGAKSTPIVAMQLQAGIEPLESRRDKSTLKFWERAKRIDSRHWSEYRAATQRLKTQTTPLAHAEALRTKYQIPVASPAPLQSFTAVAAALPNVYLQLQNLVTSKGETNPIELRISALETIHNLYPSNEWLHVYTDGSYIPETRAAGAGSFCKLFQQFSAVGKNASNFDGEICAIIEAANKIQTLNLDPSKVVFLIDSQAAIYALSNNKPTDCLNTSNCRRKIADLINRGWNVTLQWVPSHVGLPGNEKADEMAKKGAEAEQPETLQTLQAARSQIDTTISRHTKNLLKSLSTGKLWKNLATPGHIPADLKRSEAVARFRLETGHDYLQAHLHRLGIADSDICPLCSTGSMVGSHLLTCPELNHLPDDLTMRYWEARRQMAQPPPTGVG